MLSERAHQARTFAGLGMKNRRKLTEMFSNYSTTFPRLFWTAFWDENGDHKTKTIRELFIR